MAIAGKVAAPRSPFDLHSTIGRHAARAVRCAVLYETLDAQWNLLMRTSPRATSPPSTGRPSRRARSGLRRHEAPRGVLSHWAVIRDGKIANYQAVVPSTWNAGPRDDRDAMGPYEASLIGNPVADPEKPLEVIRTVHSFDPCLACAIHMLDGNGGARAGQGAVTTARRSATMRPRVKRSAKTGRPVAHPTFSYSAPATSSSPTRGSVFAWWRRCSSATRFRRGSKSSTEGPAGWTCSTSSPADT